MVKCFVIWEVSRIMFFLFQLVQWQWYFFFLKCKEWLVFVQVSVYGSPKLTVLLSVTAWCCAFFYKQKYYLINLVKLLTANGQSNPWILIPVWLKNYAFKPTLLLFLFSINYLLFVIGSYSYSESYKLNFPCDS